MRRRAWLLALAMAGSPAGCKVVECGAGTIEVNGACIAGSQDGGVECGPGTYFDPVSGACRSGLFDDGGGICGENTTIVIDDAGNRFCVGTGQAQVDCSEPILCPAPTSSSKLSICGRVYDIEDSAPIDDAAEPTGMAAKVEVRLYRPLLFVADPASAAILAKAIPDECGRYAFLDVNRPADGYIAVAVDDRTDDEDTSDDLMLSGAAATTTPGQTITGLNAWVARRDTVAMWDASAGRSGDDSFAVTGVYMPIFLDPAAPAGPFAGAPVAGAKITEGAAPAPGKDFYFSDADPLIRRTVDPAQEATLANGTGLMVETDLGPHGGQGAEPAGCTWPSSLSASVRSVVFVQERIAECD